MTKNDMVKFSEEMNILAETFTPDKELSDAKLKIYFNHFQKWEFKTFQKSCRNLLSVRKLTNTFPVPAEIEEALVTENDVILAWELAVLASGNVGMQRSVIFEDRIIHSVIKAMGGWSHFCSIPSGKDRVFAQKDFERLYKQFSKKAEHPPFLQGTHDTEHNLVAINAIGGGHVLQQDTALEFLGGTKQIENRSMSK